MEIERKYIVIGNQWREEVVASWRICQGYLQDDPKRTVRVRTRKSADDSDAEIKAYLTIKTESTDGGLSRQEFEYPLPPDDAEQLLGLCKNSLIVKTRHIIPVVLSLPEPEESSGKHTIEGKIEIDEFDGDNTGLILAEVELPDAKATFERPDYLSEEVTGIERYYNIYLSKHPYQSWF